MGYPLLPLSYLFMDQNVKDFCGFSAMLCNEEIPTRTRLRIWGLGVRLLSGAPIFKDLRGE